MSKNIIEAEKPIYKKYIFGLSRINGFVKAICVSLDNDNIIVVTF